MIFYDVIVELMNIHEIICRISNQAIPGTRHDNLARISAVNSFHQCLLQFYKIKTLRYALYMNDTQLPEQIMFGFLMDPQMIIK